MAPKPDTTNSSSDLDDLVAIERAARARAILYAVGFTALWVVLATWQAGTTYHLAPVIVAVIPAVTYVGTVTSVPLRTGLGWSAFGGVVAVGGGVLLNALDRLAGPSLLPSGGAFAETLVFSAIGFVLSAGYVAYRRT